MENHVNTALVGPFCKHENLNHGITFKTTFNWNIVKWIVEHYSWLLKTVACLGWIVYSSIGYIFLSNKEIGFIKLILYF